MIHVKGIAFVSVYVDDFDKSLSFYKDVLGLEKLTEMGNDAAFLAIGENPGLYLQGGNKAQNLKQDRTRATFALSVKSAWKTFDHLRQNHTKIIQSEPMDMGQGDYWFQFYDPSGNIIEILGGK